MPVMRGKKKKLVTGDFSGADRKYLTLLDVVSICAYFHKS